MPPSKDDDQVRVLQLDPSLGAGLDPKTRQRASRELQAPALTLEPGRWNPPRSLAGSASLGLLLTRGLLIRRLYVAGGQCVELLGSGDLIRPWQEDAASFVRARWQVLVRIEGAMLTGDFANRLCGYPQIVEALVERTMKRSRALAVYSAIGNVLRLQEGLELLFWHLAERWGKVERNGVIVPLPLTHQILADLVGARRPSVTLALSELKKSGKLSKLDRRRWRLTGSPPTPSGLDS